MPRARRTTRKTVEAHEAPPDSPATAPGAPAFPRLDWTRAAFLGTCGVSEADVEAAGIGWEELAEIHDHHRARASSLETAAQGVIQELQRREAVHSVRVRVKDPRGLIRKVIRKRTGEGAKDVRFANYTELVTDLVGVRALHLYKEDWVPIHEFVVGTWEVAEPPKAYHRRGDAEDVLAAFRAGGCDTEEHPRKYRSVHYLLKTAPTKHTVVVELQVRTLFEEGWSEIDHRLKYPMGTSAAVDALLAVLNRLAGAADEMGSLADFLNRFILSREEEAERSRQQSAEEIDALGARLASLEEQLGKSEEERAGSQRQVEQLRKRVSDLSSPATARTSADSPGWLDAFSKASLHAAGSLGLPGAGSAVMPGAGSAYSAAGFAAPPYLLDTLTAPVASLEAISAMGRDTASAYASLVSAEARCKGCGRSYLPALAVGAPEGYCGTCPESLPRPGLRPG